MTSSADPADGRDAPSEDLAALVIAAGRRGFSRWRVATALGISARGLASIEERIEPPLRGASTTEEPSL